MTVSVEICKKVCPQNYWKGCKVTKIPCSYGKSICCFECFYTKKNNKYCVTIENRYFKYVILKNKEKNERNSIK